MTRILRCAALAALVAAGPAVAQQTGETITWGTNLPANRTINATQCADAVAGQIVQLLANWTTTTDGTPFTPSPNGVYRIYASNTKWTASTATGTTTSVNYCPIIDNPTANVKAGPVATIQAVSQQVNGQKIDIEGPTGVLAVAGLTCSSADGSPIYICAHWIPDQSTSTPHGSAWGSVVLQVLPPNAPTGLGTPQPGDSSLTMGWTASGAGAGAAVSYYQINATTTDPRDPAAAPPVGRFSPHITGTSGTINGLVNGVTYTIVVFAYSLAGNQSQPSNSVQGMPLMSNDFWTSYKNQGGKEQGGCSTGGGGLLALAGAALALLRRRS